MSHTDIRMTDPFEIIVGTYEQYLLGYKVQNIVNEYKLEKSFATHSHVASIRSIASNKHYLASAGADDVVCLYDMRHRIQSGRLTHHNDTVNCVTFSPEGSHLFTCGNDGSIAAIRCGNWQMEKHWQKAHKGLAVNTLAIHPTGKIALSTGMDGVLRTWNLIKGRQAYAINLVPRLRLDAKNITIIKWSPSGEKYLLVVNQKIEIYSVRLAGIDKEFTFDSKVICAEFLLDDLIAVGFENGQIKFCDLKTSVHTVEVLAHNIRVKCMAHRNDLLVTASSSGEIKLWKYDEHSLNMLQTINCDTRITCLSLSLPCKDLLQRKNTKLEEEKKIEKKTNLRLKQEVIIEDEGEWEVTEIKTPQIKMSKAKHKKKRSMEDENNIGNLKKKVPKSKNTISSNKKRDRSSETTDATDKPRKKKKLLKANETTLSVKKQREDSATLQTVLPRKNIKESKTEQLSTASKKHKVKLSVTTDTEDAPPRKIKKKANAEEKVKSKKRKKIVR